ncbi:MAG TPA: ATP synthase F0 subunit B [Bryobacteraceae bacterium]|nr:ATP synthase F0 subunit B [Bryobacteraceae bacterium]
MKRFLLLTSLAICLAFGQHETPKGGEAGHGTAGAQDHGKAGGHEAADSNQIWWRWANFALLAAGLWYFINKSGGKFFDARAAAIRKGIEDAAAVKADADARAAEIERRVANLGKDIEALREQSKQEIAAEGARLRAETEKAVAKVQAQAELEIATATKNARLELKAYSAQLAIELAGQQISNRLTPEVQDSLISGFVNDLKEKASRN